MRQAHKVRQLSSLMLVLGAHVFPTVYAFLDFHLIDIVIDPQTLSGE